MGIKQIVNTDGVLTVYMDDDSRFNRSNENELVQEELFEEEKFQSQYCYVSVPKDKLIFKQDADIIGEVNLVAVEVNSKDYTTTSYNNLSEGYSPSMDSVWIVVEGADAQEVRLATGIDVSGLMKKG